MIPTTDQTRAIHAEMHEPILWRERVYVQDARQEGGEVWVRLSAANAPRATSPQACFAAGQILVVEMVHDPLGVHKI